MATRGQPVISHCGPYFYDTGSLTAADKDDIFKKTGVSVNIRERKQWNFQRGLTASGPPQGVEEALFLAHEKIMASVQDKPRPDEAVRARRREVAQAGRRQYERAHGSSTQSAEVASNAGASSSHGSHQGIDTAAFQAMRAMQSNQAHASWAYANQQWATTQHAQWQQNWSDWMAAQSAYAPNANLMGAMQAHGEARPPSRDKGAARPPSRNRRNSSKGKRNSSKGRGA